MADLNSVKEFATEFAKQLKAALASDDGRIDANPEKRKALVELGKVNGDDMHKKARRLREAVGKDDDAYLATGVFLLGPPGEGSEDVDSSLLFPSSVSSQSYDNAQLVATLNAAAEKATNRDTQQTLHAAAKAARDDAAARPEPEADHKARARRHGMWKETLRELAISDDPLYTFLRHMAGLIHEDATSILQVDEGRMDEMYRRQSSDRADLLRREFEMQQKIVQEVVTSIFRESSFRVDLTVPPEAAPTGGGPGGAAAAARPSTANDIVSQLVVVPSDLGDRIRNVAAGEASMGFLDTQAALQKFLKQVSSQPTSLKACAADHALLTHMHARSSTPPRLSQRLLEDMREILLAGCNERMAALHKTAEEGLTTSMSYIASPRVSFVVQLKNETYAALRQAFDWFLREAAAQHFRVEGIKAWDLMEGRSRTLTNAFAAVAAHTLASTRMYSASNAQYVSAAAHRHTKIQAGIAMRVLLQEADKHSRK